MAAMYALAIAYASLQPFGEWMAPLPDMPFWAFAPWSMRATRFDIVANVLAYLPLGCFVALVPPRATGLMWSTCRRMPMRSPTAWWH